MLRIISQGCPGFHINVVNDIFPSRDEVDAMLDDLCPDPIHPSLAALEPLIPSGSAFGGHTFSMQTYDDRGYSSYARVTSGLLHVFIQDRQVAKANMWALRHFLALAQYASDLLRIPWAQSPVFNQQALKSDLNNLIAKVQRVTTYLLTSSPDDGWRSKVIAAVTDHTFIDDSDTPAKFVAELIGHAASVNNIRESRILCNVLQHVLDKVDKDEADQWILLARRIERTSKPLIWVRRTSHLCASSF